MFHPSTTDIFNVTLAAGTAVGMTTGIVKFFRSTRVRVFLMSFNERRKKIAGDIQESFKVSKIVGDLKDTCDSQATTVSAAKAAADSAMQAVSSLKQEMAIQRYQINTLEDRYRNIMFYYNLVLNYCAQLLDYIHTLRELFAKHQPNVELPVIPAQPEKLGEARTKYLDLDDIDTKESPG